MKRDYIHVDGVTLSYAKDYYAYLVIIVYCGTQTTSTEGVLFYGRQQYPVYSHLAVSLSNASLYVSVVFAHPTSFSELCVTLGSGLDDDRCSLTTVAFTAVLSDG